MSTAVSARTAPRTPQLTKLIVLAAALLLALGFVVRDVFHYYLNFNPAGFGHFWHVRGWLLLHISSGMVAILIGPWQFSRRLRQRYLSLHRLLGRTYLIAIACGAVAAMNLAVTNPFGWAWGAGLCALAVAWLTTSGMAFYAIKQRQIQVHQEWMVRSYIVTFAFVTFRLLNDYGPTSHLQPVGDRIVTIVWVSWAIPLLFTEVILQLRRMRLQSQTGR